MRARALGLLASVLLVASPVLAQDGYPVWNGDAVQDDASILSETQEDSLRTLLAPARGVDIRILTLETIADYPALPPDIGEFAHGVFDRWRVGDRPDRDGVLLLVATEDRRLRIQLGDGVLHLEPAAQRVVDDSILPWFREGMRPRGILRGAAGIAGWFAPGPVTYSGPATPPPAYTPPPPTSTYRRSRDFSPAASMVVLGLAIGGLAVGAAALQRHLRNRPRDCGQCGAPMARLDEAGDDLYLDSGQKVEEFLRSVDYDVWKCGSCGDHLLIPYTAWFSRAGGCPTCRYRTVLTTTNVLEQATYHSGGRKEVIRDCRNCGFHDSQIVYLPQLQRSSTRSRSSSGGSSSLTSSSSSGGFSSGGGASGSW